MQDKLAIIQRVIAEHQTIHGHTKLVGEAINDLEAIFRLRQDYSGWTQSSLESLTEKRERLQQTLSFLAEGLRNHFNFEEMALPPLFGDLLMEGLILEHQEIRKSINEARPVVGDTSLESLPQEELLARKWQIQQAIASLCQLSDEHLAKEEIILKMMKRALEEEKPNRR